MLEEKIRSELRASLIKMGFDPYHPPDLKKDLQKLKGRPDLLVMGAAMLIEVKRFTNPKSAEPSIHFSDISDPQRRFLDWWTKRHRETFPRGCYIALGTQGPWSGSKTRQLFVIPWNEWFVWEYTFNPKTWTVDGNDWIYAESKQVPITSIGDKFWQYEWMWTKDPKNRWMCSAVHPIAQSKYRLEHLPEDNVQLSLRFGEMEDNNL